MIKIIFFDADGTLYYNANHPMETWKNSKTHSEAISRFKKSPTVDKTLEKLKSLGIRLIVLSTSPKEKLKDWKVTERLQYFKLINYFDEIHITENYAESKGEFIAKILNKLKIKSQDALMVGDSYKWDCEPAERNGVKALLIERSYNKDKRGTRIEKLNDILNFITEP